MGRDEDLPLEMEQSTCSMKAKIDRRLDTENQSAYDGFTHSCSTHMAEVRLSTLAIYNECLRAYGFLLRYTCIELKS